MFYKKPVLKNFLVITGKHLCRSLLFNKVAELRPATLLKKRLQHKCFCVNTEVFKIIDFEEHLRLVACSFLESFSSKIPNLQLTLMLANTITVKKGPIR